MAGEEQERPVFKVPLARKSILGLDALARAKRAADTEKTGIVKRVHYLSAASQAEEVAEEEIPAVRENSSGAGARKYRERAQEESDQLEDNHQRSDRSERSGSQDRRNDYPGRYPGRDLSYPPPSPGGHFIPASPAESRLLSHWEGGDSPYQVFHFRNLEPLTLSASLATSPLLELEDHNSMLNDGPLGEPSSSLLCSSRKSDAFPEAVKCNPESGEHLQPGVSFSDSLRLSLFDAYPDSLSAFLATSPLLELKDHSSMLNDGPLGEPSSSLLCSSRKSDAFSEAVKCNPESVEHLQPGVSFSDSLRLSLFDGHPDSTKRESCPQRVYCGPRMLEGEFVGGVPVSAQQASPVHSPVQHSLRRIYCDSPFLEEETQVLDVGALVSKQQASHPLSPVQHLQSASQAFDSGFAISEISVTLPRRENGPILKTAAEPNMSLPLLPVKQERCAMEDFDDICQRWHSRRKVPAATTIPSSPAGIGLPLETELGMVKLSTSNKLDSDHLQGQPIGVEPEQAGPCAAKQMVSAAVEDDADIVPKSHNRRRISLAAITNPKSSSNIGLPLEAKQETSKPSTSNALDADHFGGQPSVLDPKNVSPLTNLEELGAVDDDYDADIVWRWHNRKRIALTAITNLSSCSDSDPHKKLKLTPKKVLESGTLHSGHLQSELVEDPLLLDIENSCVSQYGHDRSCKDISSPRSGSETTEEDVNVNDHTDDSCDSKLLQRKLTYSCARGIKSFLQPVAARNESISYTKELGVSKPEHAEKKWTYPRKNRPRGRQRTMDAWIK